MRTPAPAPVQGRARPARLLLASWLLLLAGPAAARADIIKLRNGNEIQGELVQEDDERVVLRFPGGSLVVKRRDIIEVVRQERSELLFERGEKELLRRDYEAAIGTFQTLLTELPGSERAERRLDESRLRYAGKLRELHRYEESLREFRELQTKSPDDSEIAAEIASIEAEQENVFEEERLAAEELTSGDLATAIWRLENIFDRFPDRREKVAPILADALIDDAENLARAREWERCSRRLDEALAVAPIRVDELKSLYAKAKLQLISTEMNASAWERVEELAGQGLQIDPTNVGLLYFLGISHDARGNVDKAVEQYVSITGDRRPSRPAEAIVEMRRRAESRVRDLDGTIALADDAIMQEVLPGGFRSLKTAHFEIFHRNKALARDVAWIAERSYRSLFNALGCKTHWRMPCEIRLYASREEYLENVGVAAWSGAAHRLESRRGVFSRHSIASYQGQPRLRDGLLVHEIAHALLVHRLNYPERLPLWANEGFAVFVEPDYMHRHYHRLVSVEAARDALIPLRTLMTSTTYPDERVELFYGQSWSVANYLIGRGGIGKFVAFLRDAGSDRQNLRKSLDKHYRIPGLLALQNRWLSTLR